ncbi:MAG: hypothetical protein WCJ72_09085 [Chryseobacterium sp.]
MKKFLLSLVLIVLAVNTLFAQRDTNHWFAPYFNSSTSSTYEHGLYFSTDSVTPFPVTIYNNDAVIGTVTISKGSPQMFTLPSQYITTTNTSSAAVPNSMGVYTKGDKL